MLLDFWVCLFLSFLSGAFLKVSPPYHKMSIGFMDDMALLVTFHVFFIEVDVLILGMVLVRMFMRRRPSASRISRLHYFLNYSSYFLKFSSSNTSSRSLINLLDCFFELLPTFVLITAPTFGGNVLS